MTANNTRQIVSSELRQGDIVQAHGLRVLIDGEPQQCPGQHGVVTYYNGLVLNRDEVTDQHVPIAWTRVTTGWPEYTPTGEHRWTIQGNDNAHWLIERGVSA